MSALSARLLLLLAELTARLLCSRNTQCMLLMVNALHLQEHPLPAELHSHTDRAGRLTRQASGTFER